MNVVMVSPHFPPNFYHFCAALRRAGANVFGIADAPYDELRPELQEALTEYYRAPNALDYDQLLRGVAYLTFRHGKMDWLESHNEFWLETDARLRTDFNIPGIKNDQIDGHQGQVAHEGTLHRGGRAGGAGPHRAHAG